MTFTLIAFFLVGTTWITGIIVGLLFVFYEYIKNKKINKIINIALKNSGHNNMQEYLEKTMISSKNK